MILAQSFLKLSPFFYRRDSMTIGVFLGLGLAVILFEIWYEVNK